VSVRAGRVMAAGDAEAVVVIEGPAGWLVRAHGQASLPNTAVAGHRPPFPWRAASRYVFLIGRPPRGSERSPEAPAMVATISPNQLRDLRRRGEAITLIDVRTPAEYGEVHVDFAKNVPLDRLDPREVSALAGGGPVYFVCKSGTRSQKACEKMAAAGLTHVVSVEGGTAACEAAGVPVVRGRKAMSLERQVRICAGSIVAVGAALAAFGPDPTWKAVGAGIAGFIGCGLVFAGVTDTCGMAMMLAKMPWNQRGGTGGQSCATT